MKRSIRLLYLLPALLLALTFGRQAVAQDNKANIRVLFLGDRAGHRPAERFAILQPVMAKRNIELTYTESLEDFNPQKLAQYDCVMIYANTTRISPDQEKAFMDFVAAGNGFVPIHSASYCFRNSSNYIALVGAEFSRHGTGTFKETIVKADHPIMKGLSPIESWDETYVHAKHNPDRIVLAERRDDSGAEPYTWVRNHGKGRVFYTAWGHDYRTWNNADFQQLIENGVRWSVENSPNLAQHRAAAK